MLNFILVIIGFFLLIKGSDYLVDGASNIAKTLNIPEIVIGMTIVSIGTSLPELVVSLTSTISRHSDIAIGNVVGSNITNLLLILGICSCIRPLKFEKQTIKYENFFMIFCSLLLLFLGINYVGGKINTITRYEGALLLIFCFLFVLYNLVLSIKNDNNSSIDSNVKLKNVRLSSSIIGIFVGSIFLKIGGDFVVDNVGLIARIVGVSEKLISLTLVAFSTSLPELVTSISATRRGECDMAIGNIIGSNIFNILLIIGVSSIVNPIKYSTLYNKDMILLIFSTFLFSVYPFFGRQGYMEKKKGLVFLLIYIIYVFNLIV